ncbi:MAG: hypothetical protein O7D86_02815 [Proteobacteria bacterium]|nr:hypothetical protein [Pseudomonadota bacterium]
MSANTNTILEGLIDQISQSIPEQDKLDPSSLQIVLNNIEALGIAAGENERIGFHDICLLVKETFSDIIENTNILNDKQFELLKQWRILASNFIKDSKQSAANALKDFFKRSELNSTVAENDLNVLKDMLEKEGAQFQSLFSETLIAIENDKSFDLNILNEKLEQLLLSINEKDLSGFLDICLLFQENITEIGKSKHALNDKQKDLILNWLSQVEQFLSDTNNSKAASALINILRHDEWPISLAEIDADILLEMFGIRTSKDASFEMPNALIDLFDQFQNSVSKIYADNRETILNIANTTEAIGLAAGELDLLGFQDACLIIQENLSDMVNDESLSMQDYVTHIGRWVTLVKNYLSNPDDSDSVQNLLNYLTNEKWPNPLQHADLDILKEMMATVDRAKDQLESTIVATNEEVQGILGDILDDVVDTKDILAAPHTISKDLVEMLREKMVMIKEDVKHHIGECN